MNYIIKEPKEDTRSFLGRQVDWVGTLLLVWLLTLLLITNISGKLTTSLMCSIPLLVVEALVIRKFLHIRRQKKQNQRRLWLACQKMIRKFKKMDPEREFKPYVREIFAGLAGFQNVRLIPDEGKGNDIKKWGVDLVSDYRGAPLAIQCKYPEGDQKITTHDIRAFAGALKLAGFKNGLLVTCGEFGPGAARVVTELSRKGINIKLIGRYRLMDLARQAGSGGIPTEPAGPGMSFLTAGGNRTRIFAALKDTIFSSRTKAKSYFLYGLLLYAGFILMRGTTKLSLIYLFFAVLNLMLGACCLYLGRSMEDKDPLAGLGSEK